MGAGAASTGLGFDEFPALPDLTTLFGRLFGAILSPTRRLSSCFASFKGRCWTFCVQVNKVIDGKRVSHVDECWLHHRCDSRCKLPLV